MIRLGLLAALLVAGACTSKSAILQSKDGGVDASSGGATGGTTGTGGRGTGGVSGAGGSGGTTGTGGHGTGGASGAGGANGTGGRGTGGATGAGGTSGVGGAGGVIGTDGGVVVDSGVGSALSDCVGLICGSDQQVLNVMLPALGTTQCVCVPIASTGRCTDCNCGDSLCAPYFARCLGFSLETGLLCTQNG